MNSKITFADAVVSGFKNYANFKGSATRAQYWYWVLFVFLVGLVLTTIESAIWPVRVPEITGNFAADLEAFETQPTPLSSIASLFFLIPNLSVLVRRFHDAGFSGKWLLLWLAPLGYSIFAVVGIVLVGSSVAWELQLEQAMLFIFLILPLIAMIFVIGIVQLIFSLRPSRSFYDGNRYVGPEPMIPFTGETTS